MPDRTPNLDSLFEAAAEIESADERAAYLDQSCGDNQELRRQIEQLLQSDQQAGSFLQKPAPGLDETLPPGTNGNNQAEALDAGLATAFSMDEAVVIGDANHSVLKVLGNTLNEVPRVSLRESGAEGEDPISRPTSPEMPDRHPDSRFRLDGEIARGGMGAIIKGRDTDLGRDLAIKVLLDSHKDKPEVIQRFVEEAQIGGQLQHPGIAPIYELGQFADKRPFFAMKLVKGQTLSKLLADREDAADERGKFIGIFEQICQTMAYAHSRGVIHRDLKPANIMVGAFGEVQVMDWGLAKVLSAGGVADEKKSQTLQQGQSIIQTLRSGVGSDVPGFGSAGSETQMGSVLGTPAYMPPEQALGEIDQLDERADVFGLGAILCEILTGQPPYVAIDGTGVFRLATRGKLDDAFSRLEGCGADEDLTALTRHCLKLEPVDRPRDAGVLAERVTGYLESVEEKLREAEVQRAAEAARADAEAAQATAEGERAEAESARANEENKRRRTSLMLAASVLLLVGLGSGGWLYMLRQETNQQTAEADAQRAHAVEMQTLAEQRDDQRKAAELSEAIAVAAKQQAERDQIAALAAKQAAEAAEKRSREFRYSTDMQLAGTLIADKNANASQVLAPMADYDPSKNKELQGKQDQRGFEWHYLKRLFESRAKIFADFEHEVSAAVISPEGELVTLDANAQVQRLNLETGRPTLPAIDLGRGRDVGSKALSGDGRRAALAIGDEIHLYDTTNGEQTARPIAAKTGNGLLFSPDGRMVISVDTDVAWWDAVTGRSIASKNFRLTVDRRYSVSPSVSADGLVLAVGGQTSEDSADSFSIFKLDSVTGEVTQRLDRVGGPGSKTTIAISPDGQSIARGLRFSGGILSYETSTGEIGESWGSVHSAGISAITFNQAGTQMVTAAEDGTIMVWDDYRELESYKELDDNKLEITGKTNLVGHAEPVNLLRFVAGGKQLISAGKDKTVRVWDLEHKKSSLHRTVAGAQGSRAIFSPDGTLMVVSGDRDGVRIRDAATGEVVVALPKRDDGLVSQSVAFSPDNRLLAVGFGGKQDVSDIELWDVDRRERLAVLPGSTAIPGFVTDEHSGRVTGLAFSPDAKHLVATFGSLDSYRPVNKGSVPLLVYDTATRRLVRQLKGHQNYCVAVSFSPDGSRMASGSCDSTARIWDTTTWKELHVLSNPDTPSAAGKRRVLDVAFSPDGKLLAMATDNAKVIVWSVGTGSQLQTLNGHANTVWGVSFSPNGRTLASASFDGTIRLWNTATWRELIKLDPGTRFYPRSLAFSPNGNSLLASNFDGEALIWSTQPDGIAASPTPHQLGALLDSEVDFRNRVRMLSENPRLRETLMKLPPQDLERGPVQAALAAMHANWHASREAWPEAVEALDRFRQLTSDPPQAWLRAPGLIRVASALLQEDRLTVATDVLAAASQQMDEDGITGVNERLAVLRSELERRLMEAPQDPRLLELRAELLGFDSNVPAQVADYTAAIEARSEIPVDQAAADLQRLHRRRGCAYIEMEQWQQAVDDYAIGITDETSDENLLAKRARAYEELRNWNAAADDYSRVAKHDPRGAKLLDDFANRLRAAQQYELAALQRQRAHKMLEATLQAEPDDVRTIETLAALLLEISNGERKWNMLPTTDRESGAGLALSLEADQQMLMERGNPDAKFESLVKQIGAGSVKAVRSNETRPVLSPGDATLYFNEYQIALTESMSKETGAMRGSYVRIDLPDNNYRYPRYSGPSNHKLLSLVEVQVFQGNENVGIAGSSSQSNTIAGGVASRAIDGNTNGDFRSGASLSSQSESRNSGPWWEVDLGGEKEIDRIVVWNQREKTDLLRYFRVLILDASRNIVFEQFVMKGTQPSLEISLSGFSASSEDANPQTRGNLRLAARLVDYQDHVNAIPQSRVRLAAAYALMGAMDQAAYWYGKALDQAEADNERQQVIVQVSKSEVLLAILSQQRPDDSPLQLAVAQKHAELGRRALAEQRAADALTELKKAQTIVSDLKPKYPEIQWTVLKPTEMSSEGGATLTLQEDGSILASGMEPNQDDYTVMADAGGRSVTAFRLEALPDPTLPKGGPGRSLDWGSFHVNEFRVISGDSPVSLSDIVVTYDEMNEFRKMIDGVVDKARGWANYPKVGEQQTAVIAANPAGVALGPLKFEIIQSRYSNEHETLGRFRLSVTSDSDAIEVAKFQQEVKASGLTDLEILIGKAYAQQGQLDEAVAAFAKALGMATDRDAKTKIIEDAASVEGFLVRLADLAPDDAQTQSELALHLSEQGNVPLAELARSRARSLFENDLLERPDNGALAMELADLLLTPVESRWTVLKPTEMVSENGAILALEEDGSIFVSGVNAFQDVYLLTAPLDGRDATALRIETIPDERLNGGAGRFTNRNGAPNSFMLTEIELAVQAANKSRPLAILDGSANPINNRWAFSNAFDADRATFWRDYPSSSEPHNAIVVFPPLEANQAAARRLHIRLESGADAHPMRNLGRFRLAISDDFREFLRYKITDPWQKLAAAYHIIGDLQAFDDLVARKPTSILGRADLDALRNDWPNAAADYARLLKSTSEFSAAMVFNGRDNHIRAPHVPFDTYDAFTIEAWVMDWKGQIVSQGLQGENSENSVFLHLDKYGVWKSGDGKTDVTHFSKPPSDRWNHIAMVFDGSHQTLFLNGVSVGRLAAPQPGPLLKSRPLLIGGREAGNERANLIQSSGSGLLAALRISSSARYGETFVPAQQLAADGETVLLYDFAQTTSAGPNDVSGKGYYGRVSGPRWIVSPDPSLASEPKETTSEEDLVELQRQIAASPETPMLRVVRGDVYASLNKWPEAIAEYSAAIAAQSSTAQPFDTGPLTKRAHAYEQDLDWGAAAADWSRLAAENVAGARQFAEFVRRVASNASPAITSVHLEQAIERYRRLLEANPTYESIVDEQAELILDVSENATGWRVLKPTEMKSEGGADLTLEADGSIFVSGKNPKVDTYSIVAPIGAPFAAIKLETIPDSRLLHGGAGRSSLHGNFCLSELTVMTRPSVKDGAKDGDGVLPILDVFTRDEQQGFPLFLALDGFTTTARYSSAYPGQPRPHVALFAFAPVTLQNDASLEVVLASQKSNVSHLNLGRFRLSISDDPEVIANTRKRFAARKMTDPWAKLATAYQLIGDQQTMDELLEQHPQAMKGIGNFLMAMEEPQRAIEAYSKAIADEPTDTDLLFRRAAAYNAGEQPDLAWIDLRRAIKLQPDRSEQAFETACRLEQWSLAAEFGQRLIEQTPEDSIRIKQVFESFRKSEQWSLAAEFGQRFVEQKPEDSKRWVRVAPTVFLSGDEESYATFCQSILDQPLTTPNEAERAVKACLLRAGSVDISDLPRKALADGLVDGAGPDWFPRRGWATRALLAYRSGDADTAIMYVAKSEEQEVKPNDFLHALNLSLRALAQHDLRQSDEARATLAEASQLITGLNEDPDNKGKFDFQIAEILFREAEEKIAGTTASADQVISPDESTKTRAEEQSKAAPDEPGNREGY